MVTEGSSSRPGAQESSLVLPEGHLVTRILHMLTHAMCIKLAGVKEILLLQSTLRVIILPLKITWLKEDFTVLCPRVRS